MTLLPFKKPATQAVLQSISAEARKEFVADMLDAVLRFEADQDAVGYVTVILYKNATRRIWWQTVSGSGVALEGALRRSGQHIIKYLRTKEG